MMWPDDLKISAWLRGRMERLSPWLERPAAFVAMAGMLIFLGGLLYWNAVQAVGRLTQKVESREILQGEIAELAAQVRLARTDGRNGGPSAQGERIDSLPAWLEKNVRAAGLENRLQQITPVTGRETEIFREKVTMRLEGISMAELVKMTDRIEKTAGIRVTAADIRRQSEPAGGVAVTMELGLL